MSKKAIRAIKRVRKRFGAICKSCARRNWARAAPQTEKTMSDPGFMKIINDDSAEQERSYVTCGDSRTRFTEKKSVFIASCAHVENENEAMAFVQRIKAEFPDARHNVYAYRVGGGSVPVMRFSDDGEPKGTAGMPVLECITKSGIVNVAVVVTRYFGGILLGASGLTRAYSNAASDGLAAAGKIRMVTARTLKLHFGYDQYGRITKVLENFSLIKTEPVFAENVTLEVSLPTSQLARFVTEINDATSATCSFEAGVKEFKNIEE